MTRERFFVSNFEEVIIRSELPQEQFLYTPSVIKTPTGSVIVSCDIGGQVDKLRDYVPFRDSNQKGICRIYRRNKDQQDFESVESLNIIHARLFSIGERIYILGHNGRPQISCSQDDGQTWSSISELSDFDGWQASACAVWKTKDRLYLCMDRRADKRFVGWNVAGMSPMLLSVAMQSDLTDKKNWKISNSFAFSDLFESTRFEYFGLPFLATGHRWPALSRVNNKVYRSSPMGWLEGNVVQILDPNHIWFDPYGKTFYVLLRCNTAGVGYAAIVKFVEDEHDDLYAELARAPSGEAIAFLPVPGGHNKFFTLYDDATSTYWMASVQPINSMRKLEHTPEKFWGLPNNERHRLVLHFSKNCVDWAFAGVISIGKKEHHARNYPSMIIDGSDLLIASRSGDDDARDNQYTNTIMLHRVGDFRTLIY